MEGLELLRTTALALHAGAAVVAWVAGVVLLRTGAGLVAHAVGVILMAAALGPSLILGWGSFPPVAKAMFSGLAVLAVVMVAQVVRARGLRSREQAGGQVWWLPGGPITPGLVRTVGFNVISLSVAGTIVPILRLGSGTLGILIAAALIVPMAHVLVERRRNAILTQLKPAIAARL